jgi:hypothetical protein
VLSIDNILNVFTKNATKDSNINHYFKTDNIMIRKLPYTKKAAYFTSCPMLTNGCTLPALLMLTNGCTLPALPYAGQQLRAPRTAIYQTEQSGIQAACSVLCFPVYLSVPFITLLRLMLPAAFSSASHKYKPPRKI